MDQRLLQAMNSLLEEGEDFSNTSIERLTKKAGISRATFYLHFKDKAELIEFLFDEVEEALIKSAGQWFIDASNATQESFRNDILSILTAYRANYAVIAAMHQTATGNERIRELNDKMIDGFCKATERAISQLHAANRANEAVTFAVGELITKSVFYVSASDPRTISEAMIEQTADAWAHIVRASFAKPGA